MGQLSVEAVILDRPVVIKKLQHAAVSTFEEYFNSVLAPYSLTQLDVKRLDIVWEVYEDGFLKKATKDKR